MIPTIGFEKFYYCSAVHDQQYTHLLHIVNGFEIGHLSLPKDGTIKHAWRFFWPFLKKRPKEGQRH
jgi:hypothetical protein